MSLEVGIIGGVVEALAPVADPEVIAEAVNDYLEEHPEATCPIDDTAGEGDTGKVWSADKTAGEVASLTEAIENDLPETKTSDASDVDVDLTDENGNVILRLAGGHIQTKNFDSSNIVNPVKTRMEFEAHNGANYFAPECTIPAYRIAGQQGWEEAGIAGIDFSTDGTMYVIHDDTVDRTTDGTGKLNEMSDAQINALHITQTGAGYSLSDFDSSELVIPTFEQVLAQCVRYGMKMFIRLAEFPNSYTTASDIARWDAFVALLKAYNVQNDDISCYVDTAAKASICRNLLGNDVEISTFRGATATAQDIVDWFDAGSITGKRAGVIHINNIDMTAVKLMHTNGIRVRGYGVTSEATASTFASLGIDSYQNGRYNKIYN